MSLLATGLLLGQSGELLAQTAPTVLWRGDHEEGTTADWWSPGPPRVEGNNCGGEYNNGAATTDATTAQKHAGAYGLALRVPNMNTGNSEGARAFRWCEAQQHAALYYSSWYDIPAQVTVNSWWHLMEWKSHGSNNAKFMLAVGNRPDGQMYLFLGRGQDSGGGGWQQNLMNLPVGRWFHLEAYYRKATDASGQVTVWQDGVQILDVSGVQTANSDDLGWAVINYGQYTSPSDVTIYADDAAISTTRLGPGSIPSSPSPTTTPPPAPTATPLPSMVPAPAAPVLTIYSDALETGWEPGWSWNTEINPDVQSPVYAGSRSLSATFTAPWAGLQLMRDGGSASASLATAPYSYLSFAARATRSGQRVAIQMVDAQGRPFAPFRSLADFGGDPPTGTWHEYRVPLSALGAAGVRAGGLRFHEWTGAAQPMLYFDAIRLTS